MEPGFTHSEEVTRPFTITMVSTLERNKGWTCALIVGQTLGRATGNFGEQQAMHSWYQD